VLEKVADQARRATGAATGRRDAPGVDLSGVAEGVTHGHAKRDAKTIFDLESLTVRYDGKPAVRDVTMGIHEN
jgi:hypothetical protein